MKNKKEDYYSLLNDTTFKYLFLNSRTRPIMEKMVFKITGISLDGYNLIYNELPTGNNIKDYRLDLVFEKDKNIINIEMNKEVGETVYHKNHEYIYRLAGNLYDEGEDYKELRYVEQINFNNCRCPVSEDTRILTYELSNIKHKLKIEGIKIHEVYLDNFSDICYTSDIEKEMYINLIKAESYEEMKEIGKMNKEAMILVEEVGKLICDNKYAALHNYEREREKMNNSIRIEAREEGSLSTKKEIAKSLKKDNMDIKLISKYTGLSIDEIRKI